MICDIKFNYIMLVNKKCELCKCTLIMKSLNINNLYILHCNDPLIKK